MKHNKPQIEYGVCPSVIACRNYKVDIQDVILASLNDLGVKRFRLMSYWNEIEKSPGEYSFNALDDQIKMISAAGGTITLCLGQRQPRWPECHIPQWATEVPKAKRDAALLRFIEIIVQRYKDNDAIVSYQLENEALNHGIGLCKDYDRKRLRTEFNLVKSLDGSRPVIMSTSNSWGLPIRRPIPDVIGFSYYLYQWEEGGPSAKPVPWVLHWVRRWVAKWLLGKPSFCHELQTEPWGPKGNELLDEQMQQDLMSKDMLNKHFDYAEKTGVSTIDLWGVEWWYWRKTKHKDSMAWETVKARTN